MRGIDVSTEKTRQFDLEERTAVFARAIVAFARKMKQNPVNNPMITQLVKAGTSVGANYCEADDGISRKDFRFKIGLCKKEARETKYWLRIIGSANEELKLEARELWKEAKELHLIFVAIFRNSKTASDISH
ncbi:MAG: four helix bundle protein [Phycisphaerae bacterium]|nr:four helix bundle protein [Phycisphaerae bacterium]